MGEPWLMGALLIGPQIQHSARKQGEGGRRSIVARKYVWGSYWIRWMTAAGDVFGNLILTQSNSGIVLPHEWTQSSWASSITAVQIELCTCVVKNSPMLFDLIFNPGITGTTQEKCRELFIFSGNNADILVSNPSLDSLSCLDSACGKLYSKNETVRYS